MRENGLAGSAQDGRAIPSFSPFYTCPFGIRNIERVMRSGKREARQVGVPVPAAGEAMPSRAFPRISPNLRLIPSTLPYRS